MPRQSRERLRASGSATSPEPPLLLFLIPPAPSSPSSNLRPLEAGGAAPPRLAAGPRASWGAHGCPRSGMDTGSFLAVSEALGRRRGREGGMRLLGPVRSPAPQSPDGLAAPPRRGCSGTAPHRLSYNSREGFFSFWVGCSVCFTDVIMNRSLITSPSRNCVGRGLAVSQRGCASQPRSGGAARTRDSQP